MSDLLQQKYDHATMQRDKLKRSQEFTEAELKIANARLEGLRGSEQERVDREARMDRLSQKPMDATRVMTALRKRPDLMWEVAQGLHEFPILGPWQRGHPTATNVIVCRLRPDGRIVAQVCEGAGWGHWKGYALSNDVKERGIALGLLMANIDEFLFQTHFVLVRPEPYVAEPWQFALDRDNGTFEVRFKEGDDPRELALICQRDNGYGWYSCMGDERIVETKEEARERCDGILGEAGWLLAPTLK
jgi:hypothetical protein